MHDNAASLELDNPFWRFSLHTYRQPGVPQTCLDLQNRYGVDVNLLLFWLWAGQDLGVVATADHVKQADETIAEWRTNMILPLRSARTWAKTQPLMADEACARLRDAIKRDELVAEQIQQALLFEFARKLPRSSARATELARTNAILYLYQFSDSVGTRASEVVSRLGLEWPLLQNDLSYSSERYR